MTITTEEAERLADRVECVIGVGEADAIRSLAAERDALRVEVERLKAGGCARDQGATQFCAEAVALKAENVNFQDDLASAERERAHQHGRADRNAAEYAREQKKREQLQAENARLREALDELLRCTEKHVFGDECKAQRNKARAALGEKE
jgi:hypothetical protein